MLETLTFYMDISFFISLCMSHEMIVLNLEMIMDADCGCDCFELPISEVLQDQYLGILDMLCS